MYICTQSECVCVCVCVWMSDLFMCIYMFVSPLSTTGTTTPYEFLINFGSDVLLPLPAQNLISNHILSDISYLNAHSFKCERTRDQPSKLFWDRKSDRRMRRTDLKFIKNSDGVVQGWDSVCPWFVIRQGKPSRPVPLNVCSQSEVKWTLLGGPTCHRTTWLF